jgi:hypothetical protein
MSEMYRTSDKHKIGELLVKQARGADTGDPFTFVGRLLGFSSCYRYSVVSSDGKMPFTDNAKSGSRSVVSLPSTVISSAPFPGR